MDMSRANNSVKNGRNSSISNPKPDFLNINAHIKSGEKSIDINSIYHLEMIIRCVVADNCQKLTKFAH